VQDGRILRDGLVSVRRALYERAAEREAKRQSRGALNIKTSAVKGEAGQPLDLDEIGEVNA
jgi:hypothetical protein